MNFSVGSSQCTLRLISPGSTMTGGSTESSGLLRRSSKWNEPVTSVAAMMLVEEGKIRSIRIMFDARAFAPFFAKP